MERGLGSDSVPPPGSFDKSKVLDVRPLRCLAPVVPSPQGVTAFYPPQVPPFVYAPAFGPYPPGFTAFYPFYPPPEYQRPPDQHSQTPSRATNHTGPFVSSYPVQTPPAPMPSYRTPPPTLPPIFSGSTNGDARSSRKSSKTHQVGVELREESETKGDSIRTVTEDGCSDNLKQPAQRLFNCNVHNTDAEATSSGERQKGELSNKRVKSIQEVRLSSAASVYTESVGSIVMKFDALRRRICQVEDTKDPVSGVTRRADLKAGTIMMNNGLRTNLRKRVGAVPGVEIGDIFFFRMEMCLVGLHAPSMAGIDYTSLRFNEEEEPVAVSIVSSGAYEDDVDDGDVLIYSGQGGNVNRKDKQVVDQKLERGNLALEKSLRRGNELRVIRGMKDVGNPTGKVYIYDGLYKIQESWTEKGKSGCNVFKYKLVRQPGQAAGFTIWRSIQVWKEGIISRRGLILPDLTSGAENLPVSLVNDVDDEKGPAYFSYFPGLKHAKPASSLESSFGCKCKGVCSPGNHNCSCIKKNGGDLPYIANRVLVSWKSVIHECGPSCPCQPHCSNRASQTGLKVRLEVFKTKDRGWGLQSWDPIRAGSFICEYAGEVIEGVKVEEDNDEVEDNDYTFDATCTYQVPADFSYIPELLGEEKDIDMKKEYKTPSPLMINAKNVGNVARFMNHSCSPNVFWLPVLHEHSNGPYLHIAFYAIKHIRPLTELVYDYGMSGVHHRRKRCSCGSSNCRGYFG
ncbi:histone-lysine N-methyltransferase, H3 lysine-9 specific SUVH1-like [Telopea speciosissima]|uniref:histone-lysine N-methyltransferase, H3 lysine-9 specific SUVH1-like n=1 Tax=Telopea speciosissima TaxID=54955 RepID=UPI001CC517E3|nr:histone-lysine N-methyltransferase, H3 lysine-9 specific SUVH1-like [Telopea speciosissima]